MRTSRRRVLALFGTAVAGDVTSFVERVGGSDFYGAWLTSEKQLPPVETDAVGVALFRAGPDRRRVEYWLFVADIEAVHEAHIHKGPSDLNGNVVAYLFGPAQQPVTKTGLLSSGTLTDSDLVWPLTGTPDLLAEMRDANVYVNVHTTDHSSGEIRGQIRPFDGRIDG